MALILSEHFFVETIWVPVWRPLEGKRGQVIEVCGTRANVEIADYVHDFLTRPATGSGSSTSARMASVAIATAARSWRE